ncbi:MAG: 2'-5' RNA ligase family protein [Pseudomonadota bacterium]
MTTEPAFYVVSFPTVSATNAAWITRIRNRYDPNVDLIAGHFTLCFGLRGISQEALTEHVEQVASEVSAIPFECRSVSVGEDHVGPDAYVFLIPERGGDAITRLHAALHTGFLSGHLNQQIPFVPHLTLGRVADRNSAARICADLNDQDVHVEGQMASLSVVRRIGPSVEICSTVPLQ